MEYKDWDKNTKMIWEGVVAVLNLGIHIGESERRRFHMDTINENLCSNHNNRPKIFCSVCADNIKKTAQQEHHVISEQSSTNCPFCENIFKAGQESITSIMVDAAVEIRKSYWKKQARQEGYKEGFHDGNDEGFKAGQESRILGMPNMIEQAREEGFKAGQESSIYSPSKQDVDFIERIKEQARQEALEEVEKIIKSRQWRNGMIVAEILLQEIEALKKKDVKA